MSTSDSPKPKITYTALHAMKRAKRRATEKILQKLGQSQETKDDDDYEKLRQEFSNTRRDVVMLLTKFQLWADALAKWQRCGDALALEIGTFMQHGNDDGEAMETLKALHENFTETQAQVSLVCNGTVDAWSDQILNPLRDVMHYDSTLREKVQQRARDKIDFDSYRRQTKSKGNNQSVVAKLEVTKDRFESNDKFLLKEFRRLRETRSELVVEEVSLAVKLQMDFMKAIHAKFESGFQDTVPRIEDQELQTTKRRNKWIQNGCKETKKFAGYLDLDRMKSMSSSFGRNKVNRSQSARHCIRNVPRSRTTIKQMSLSSLVKLGSEDTKTTFVLPPATEVTEEPAKPGDPASFISDGHEPSKPEDPSSFISDKSASFDSNDGGSESSNAFHDAACEEEKEDDEQVEQGHEELDSGDGMSEGTLEDDTTRSSASDDNKSTTSSKDRSIIVAVTRTDTSFQSRPSCTAA